MTCACLGTLPVFQQTLHFHFLCTVLKAEDTNVSPSGQTQVTTSKVLSTKELEGRYIGVKVLLMIKTSSGQKSCAAVLSLMSLGEGQVQSFLNADITSAKVQPYYTLQ